MPFWRTYYHVTWSTQDRRPQIPRALEHRLYAVIRGVAERHETTIHALDGTADHLHLVISVPPTIALAPLIGQMKGASARFLNREGGLEDSFSWSPGYGLFTIGPSQLSRIVAYVQMQRQHHQQGTLISVLERTDEPAKRETSTRPARAGG